VALAHLDGNGTDEAVTAMVSRVQELALGYPEGRIELQLIGGFRDQQNFAEDLFCSIMRKLSLIIFHKFPASIHSYYQTYLLLKRLHMALIIQI